ARARSIVVAPRRPFRDTVHRLRARRHTAARCAPPRAATAPTMRVSAASTTAPPAPTRTSRSTLQRLGGALVVIVLGRQERPLLAHELPGHVTWDLPVRGEVVHRVTRQSAAV